MIYEFFQDIQFGRVKLVIFAKRLIKTDHELAIGQSDSDSPVRGNLDLIETLLCTSELSYEVNISNSLG